VGRALLARSLGSGCSACCEARDPRRPARMPGAKTPAPKSRCGESMVRFFRQAERVLNPPTHAAGGCDLVRPRLRAFRSETSPGFRQHDERAGWLLREAIRGARICPTPSSPNLSPFPGSRDGGEAESSFGASGAQRPFDPHPSDEGKTVHFPFIGRLPRGPETIRLVFAFLPTQQFPFTGGRTRSRLRPFRKLPQSAAVPSETHSAARTEPPSGRATHGCTSDRAPSVLPRRQCPGSRRDSDINRNEGK
jgi:hypothetical protein